MSNKIKKQLAQNEKKITIDDIELKYLNDIDTVERSFVYYYGRLKTNYLQQLAIKNGYSLEDELEFSIDLKSDSKELTIKKLN